MARRRKNMRYRGQPDMPEIGLVRRPGTGSFKVTASRDDVESFADQWPGSGMHGKSGFSAEFDANGDLIDLSGWAYNFNGDGAALSALIDDMKAFGLAQQRRASNPRRKKRNPTQKLTNKQMWHILDMLNLYDQGRKYIVRASDPGILQLERRGFVNLTPTYYGTYHRGHPVKGYLVTPRSKARVFAQELVNEQVDLVTYGKRRRNPRRRKRRRNPSEQEINDRFEELAGSVGMAYMIMNMAQEARQNVSGDRFRLGARQRSVGSELRKIGKRRHAPTKAIEYYIRHFLAE